MSWVIWITGLPGSGKTTLARAFVQALETRGVRAVLLELGEIRRALVPCPSRSPVEEEIVHRALACAAKLLSEAGVPVVVDATAPRRSWRQAARGMIERYAEVQLLCPPEVCGSRERAVRWRLYAASSGGAADARQGEPDIVLEYEYSTAPELIVYTDVEHPQTAVRQLVVLAMRLEQTAEPRSLHAERRST
jgi:adenylylsulfate kinase